jgi:chromosomal replication initiator protein
LAGATTPPIHAVRLIEDLRSRDADMDGDVRTLLRQLED